MDFSELGWGPREKEFGFAIFGISIYCFSLFYYCFELIFAFRYRFESVLSLSRFRRFHFIPSASIRTFTPDFLSTHPEESIRRSLKNNAPAYLYTEFPPIFTIIETGPIIPHPPCIKEVASPQDTPRPWQSAHAKKLKDRGARRTSRSSAARKAAQNASTKTADKKAYRIAKETPLKKTRPSIPHPPGAVPDARSEPPRSALTISDRRRHFSPSHTKSAIIPNACSPIPHGQDSVTDWPLGPTHGALGRVTRRPSPPPLRRPLLAPIIRIVLRFEPMPFIWDHWGAI